MVVCSTRMSTRRTIAAAASVLAIISGCARHDAAAPGASSAESATTAAAAPLPDATIAVPAGQYTATFDAAREELRDLGFVLDRVDAQLGVITTLPKGSGGVATPWDREQSSIEDELNDAVHRSQRVVRIEYAPADGSASGASDLRTLGGPLTMSVNAVLQRVQLPGWRLNTQGILYSTYSRDTILDARGMSIYAVPIRQDSELARWLADRIEARARALAQSSQ